jgi:hypothetical protein
METKANCAGDIRRFVLARPSYAELCSTLCDLYGAGFVSSIKVSHFS